MKCKHCDSIGSYEHKDTKFLYCRLCARKINTTWGQTLIDILPRCGDAVYHEPSGETWEVAYVIGDTLSPSGWPDSLADLSDCNITRYATDEQHKAAVKRWLDSRCSDLRRSRVKGLYGHLFPEIIIEELEMELLGALTVQINATERVKYLESKLVEMKALL